MESCLVKLAGKGRQIEVEAVDIVKLSWRKEGWLGY